MLEEFGVLGAKPSSVPMKVNTKLKHEDNDLLNDPSIYKQLIGKLMYIVLTRPDIAYGVHVLSQFMDRPTQSHLNATYKVLRYLKGTPSQGLFLSSSLELKITAYSDND